MIPMVDSAATLERCRGPGRDGADAVVGRRSRRSARWWSCGRPSPLSATSPRLSDFLSIGTNDLTASILGLGRRDPSLTPARLREPAVLDAVARTVRAGRAHGGRSPSAATRRRTRNWCPTCSTSAAGYSRSHRSMMDEVRDAVGPTDLIGDPAARPVGGAGT